MQATPGHVESTTLASSKVALPRVAVYSASRHWDTVLGLEGGGDPLDVSFGDTAALCFRTPNTRSELRKAAGVMRELDIRCVLVLCSGQRTSGASETLFVVEDHVNWTGDNPLIGMRSNERGERFVDMTCAYDRDIRTALLGAAREAGIPVESGVAVDGLAAGIGFPEQSVVVSGLAQLVIVARQAGVQVGAVAWLNDDLPTSDGTSSDELGYGIKGLGRFVNLAASSLAAHTHTGAM